MRRIGLAVILALGLALTWSATEAQQTPRVSRVGCLWGPAPVPADMEGFRQGLRELGYVEGKNLVIEWRFAEGHVDRLPGLAAALVGLKVDVIVTVSGTAAVAAQRATTDTPIVFTYVPDPVALGLVNSLGRPGGNITGVATLQEELTAKRLEFLKAAVPSLKSVVILSA